MMAELQEKEKSELILVKKESTTDEARGCVPENRPVEQLIAYGVVNINKVAGPTSHQVADMTKKIMNVSKAGHSGSLDPNVTGVLPIALEKVTRIAEFMLGSEKEYVAWMHLHELVSEEKIRKTVDKFIGTITQLPPRKSAVKRQERQRNVSYINLLEIKDREVLFQVGCQAGTYIRKLIHDMGKELETGAHMAQLIRTKAGPFTYKTWHALQDLKDAYEFYKEGDDTEIRKVVLPYEQVVSSMKKIWVHDSAIDTLCHGSSLGVPGVSKCHANILPGDRVAFMTLKEELIGIGVAQLTSQEMYHNQKGLAAVSNKVFMERGTYKRI